MRIKRTLAVIVTAAMATATLAIASPSIALARGGTTAAVTTALNGVPAGLVEQAVLSITDADSAAQTVYVDVPFDPAKGVTLTQDGTTTVVGLPDAAHLKRGVRTNGVVAYSNPNGSDVVVVPTATGAQFLTVVENADAPEDYAYPLTLEPGNTVQVAASGAALVLDGAGKPVSTIAAPWAVNADGSVATSFSTNGKTLTQHIAHKASGMRYPVVADPNYTWYPDGVVITFNRWDTGVIGASAAFTSVWVAAAAVGGQLGNKLYRSIWYIQVIAAYNSAVGQCLWIWVPKNGDLSAGGYRC